jgi:hypothetical protein
MAFSRFLNAEGFCLVARLIILSQHNYSKHISSDALEQQDVFGGCTLGKQIRINETVYSCQGIKRINASIFEFEHMMFETPFFGLDEVGGHDKSEEKCNGNTHFSSGRELQYKRHYFIYRKKIKSYSTVDIT